MEIGDWKATSELNLIYRRARELGIEQNLVELEAYGFTIVEPEKVAPKGFAQRMLEATMAIAAEEDPMVVHFSAMDRKDRPADARQLYHLVTKNPIFAEAVMNPVSLTIGKYLMGASARLSTTNAIIKEGVCAPTQIHTDAVGVPPPMPAFGTLVNMSWILTDYTKEKGTFAVVPGSHRYCRHPTALEQPGFAGGANDDDLCIPIIAKPGSLFVFHGNLWHGAYAKTDPGLRVHIITRFCRNYVTPAEDFDDVSDELVQRFGPEFGRLVGRDTWQGYRGEGPIRDQMALVRRAAVTPSA
jgi:ectoine hydroxylase-related dioxygenase (phytanoyl-CoA dioxygenase family)